MKQIKFLLTSLIAFFINGLIYAQSPVTVGGALMYPSENIIENAMNSKDHTTLVAAVKAAGLVETLEGTGPFTVFAPTNEAFAILPAGNPGQPAETRKQSSTDFYPDLSCRFGKVGRKSPGCKNQ